MKLLNSKFNTVMIINSDMWDVIADVELLWNIKKHDWPKVVWTFRYMMTSEKERSFKARTSSLIQMDAEYGIPEVALWFAINDNSIDPNTYVSDLTLPLLYNNGFIKDIKNSSSIIQLAIDRDNPSIDALAIITKHDSAMYAVVFEKAIKNKQLDVIKWIYSTNPSVIFASPDMLIDLNASINIMEFYVSIYPNWLSGANATIMRKIHSQLLVYNDALRWLIVENGFDLISLVVANDGEFMQNMFNRAYYRYCINPIDGLLEDFGGVIQTLSPERLESIATMIYIDEDEEYFEQFMKAITNATIPASIIIDNMHFQGMLKVLYNTGRISGDFELVKVRVFAEYDVWYPSDDNDADMNGNY